MCWNLHESANTQRPLFHEEQMRFTSSLVCLPAGGGAVTEERIEVGGLAERLRHIETGCDPVLCIGYKMCVTP